MIDWVMPPQTSVALYIYRWGGLAPQGILLQLEIRKDSSILLGLGVHRSDRSGPLVRPVWPLPDRLQDALPVRPLRDTGLTGGVSLIGLVPNLGVNTMHGHPCGPLAKHPMMECKVIPTASAGLLTVSASSLSNLLHR
jgi:hypothetical protein